MSICLRPVIEKWGGSYSYRLDHDEVVSLIDAIAWMAGTGDICDGQISHAEYGDTERVWLKDGEAFLDYLAGHDESEFCAAVLACDAVEDLSGEQYSEYEGLRAMVPEWRSMIDPTDGSLRFYVD